MRGDPDGGITGEFHNTGAFARVTLGEGPSRHPTRRANHARLPDAAGSPKSSGGRGHPGRIRGAALPSAPGASLGAHCAMAFDRPQWPEAA
jgi:hypothetical protein